MRRYSADRIGLVPECLVGMVGYGFNFSDVDKREARIIHIRRVCMRKQFEIKGCVEVPIEITEDELWYKLIS